MMVLASALAASLVVAQGVVVWGFLRFVRSFGAYTESQERFTKALLTTHESNLIVHQQNIKALGELQRIHTVKVGAA